MSAPYYAHSAFGTVFFNTTFTSPEGRMPQVSPHHASRGDSRGRGLPVVALGWWWTPKRRQGGGGIGAAEVNAIRIRRSSPEWLHGRGPTR